MCYTPIKSVYELLTQDLVGEVRVAKTFIWNENISPESITICSEIFENPLGKYHYLLGDF